MKTSSRLHVKGLLGQALTGTKHRVGKWLEFAEAKHPEQLADYGVTASGAGGSSVEGCMLRELVRGEVPMEHQRASEDYKRVQIGKFCQAANDDALAELKSDLRAHPPERGRIYPVADPHFQDYRPKSAPGLQEDGSMIEHSLLARAAHAVHNPKSNARSNKADPFLCIAIAWRSGGRPFVRLVHIEFLMGLTVSDNVAHARIIENVIRRLRRRVEAVLVDSWYDDAKLRAWFRNRGIRLLNRLRFGPAGTRYIWIDGTRRSLQDLAQEAVADPKVEGGPLRRWGPEGAATSYDVKRIFVRGILGEADPKKIHPDLARVETVELQVALKPGKKGPEIDWEHTSAVIMNADVKRVTGFVYYLRWTIETHFQVVVESEAVTREQLAARMAVNFVTLATLVRMAVSLRDIIVDLYPDERLGGVPVRRLPLRGLIRAALVEDLTR